MGASQIFHRPSFWIVSAGLIVYLLFSLLYLDLPGLQYDEVAFVNSALGNQDGSFLTWQVKLGHAHIPVMIMRYCGAVKSYIYAPILAIFGASVWTVRLPVVLFGIITLVLTYRYVKAMLGRRTALLTFVLLAVDATFIFANRQDWGPISLMMVFKSAVLYLLWRWLNGGRLRLLALACFILGVGFFEKVIFAWFIAALAVAVPLCFWPQLKPKLTRRVAITGLAFFLAGCAPLLFYNIRHPLITFRDEKGFTDSWQQALQYRYHIMHQTFDSRALLPFFNGYAPDPEIEDALLKPSGGPIDAAITRLLQTVPHRQSLIALAFVLSLAMILIQVLGARFADHRGILFFILMGALITFFICITAEATAAHHVVAVYPFHLIVIAAAIHQLLALSEGLKTAVWRVFSYSTLCIGTGVVVASSMVVDLSCLKSFKVLGGEGRWSDAIYRLGAFVKNNPGRQFKLMDWGFGTQLLVLSKDRINYEEVFHAIVAGKAEKERIEAVYPYLLNPSNWFVFHYSPHETYAGLEDFKNALGLYSQEPYLIQSFFQRDGKPIYFVCGILHPELDTFLELGNYFYFREAEEYDRVSGGKSFSNGTASQMRSLGPSWGTRQSDFAAYRWEAGRRIADAFLTIRYASSACQSRPQVSVEMDGRPAAILNLDCRADAIPGTEEWTTGRCALGPIEPGSHDLSFHPLGNNEPIRMDFFYIASGSFDFPLPKPDPISANGAFRQKEIFNPDITGFEDRSDVRLEINSPVLHAGSSTLAFRVVNLDARAVDLRYTLNGNYMPIMRNWALDENHSAAGLVSSNTPRGLYVFKAIRDSDRKSPVGWIRLDVPVLVQ
jgi:4-amino-4-deoxy-L-arabinose transferase-like glycosyltransferase